MSESHQGFHGYGRSKFVYVTTVVYRDVTEIVLRVTLQRERKRQR